MGLCDKFITFVREIRKSYINFSNFKILFILKFALADCT
jgi:hypothetical protein